MIETPDDMLARLRAERDAARRTERRWKIIKNTIGVIAVIALSILVSLWCAYVFSILWAWFIVPVFGVPALTVLQAWGIKIVVGVFFYGVQHSLSMVPKRDESSKWFHVIGGILSIGLGYALSLGWGYVITLFM